VYRDTAKLVLLIDKCKNAKELDEQITILYEINVTLPRSHQLQIPSLITKDYVRKALDIIEERITFPDVPAD
jgi:hypothetical protein